MVPEKRKLMVVSGAIAALFALPACAPAGYNAADYNAGAAPEAQPVGNEAEDKDSKQAAQEEAADDEDAPEVSEEDLTTELVAQKVARMGQVVKDQNGFILYRFDKDDVDPSRSNCDGECAEVWPPALTDGEPELDGVSADLVGTVERKDGTKQLTLDGSPLYRYIGDKKAGQWKGQGVAGTWFVIQPNGKKNLTCLPKGKPKAVSPPGKDDKDANDKDSGAGGSGDDYNY